MDLANYAIMTVMEIDNQSSSGVTQSLSSGVVYRGVEPNKPADEAGNANNVNNADDEEDEADKDPKDITPLSMVDPRKLRKHNVDDELKGTARVDPRECKCRFA